MKLRICILCITVLFSTVVLAGNRVRLAVGEWPPYVSEQLPNYGFASQLTSEAFAAVGVEVEYGFFPWKRAFEYARKGQGLTTGIWHGSLAWVDTSERTRDFLFSDAVITDEEVLFHLQSQPIEWQTIEDLRGKTIGGTMHTVYPLLDRAERLGMIRMERLGNYNVLFNRLLRKRIDAVPQIKSVAQYFFNTSLSEAQRSRITYSPTVLQRREYCLMLSRSLEGNKGLMELFNKGLRILKENGRYDQLSQLLDEGVYEPVDVR